MGNRGSRPRLEQTGMADKSQLTLCRIYGGDEFKTSTKSFRWHTGSEYTALEDSKVEKGQEIVAYDAATGERSVLVSASELIPDGLDTPIRVEDYSFSKNSALALIYTNSKRVWRKNSRGDYWLLDRSSGKLRQLGGEASPASMMFAKFSPDASKVAFVRERQIFVEDLLTQNIRCLTPTSSLTIVNGTADWVNEEELNIRDGFRWSPCGDSIAYWQFDVDGVDPYPLVNNTKALYPEITWFPYPKVGQANSACRIGVVSLASQKTVWMQLPGDPREHYVSSISWHQEQLLIQQLNRHQNLKRVFTAKRQNGVVAEIAVDRDEAWIEADEKISVVGNGQVALLSERTGWRKLHLFDQDGGSQVVAPGEFDVIETVHLDEKQDHFYFLASPKKATQRYLYRAALDGAAAERITPKGFRGVNLYQISPDGNWAFHTHSTFDEPPKTTLVSIPEHDASQKLISNQKLKRKIGRLERQPTEFLRIEAEGVEYDAWFIKPPGFDPKKKYPLVIYVYGEPADTTVVDRWNGQSYLWHLMLAQRGCFVVSIDNRGTRVPRGRDWRKSIYGKIGVLPPKDQAAALKQLLKDHPYLDADRGAIWGWSGGGSMSLNAVFKYPELYGTAIAIASVPNQRYYDTIYQERYMGLPTENVDGFREGSPINYVEKLKGNLLIIHGTGDDNCHYQTFEMLLAELIRHGKDFSMMAYPNGTHAIREGKNTTMHLRRLMTQYLLDHLHPASKGSKR